MSQLPRIAKYRDRLYDAFFPWLGSLLDLPALQAICLAARPVCGDETALFESVRHLAGQHFSPEEAYRLAWRLAGNRSRLAAGQPAPPWVAQHEVEWVPLQILEMRLEPGRKRPDVRFAYTLRVWGGTPCPGKLRVCWSRGAVGAVGRRIGFSRLRGKYPLRDPGELVGLVFEAKLEPLLTRDGQPGFRELRCPPSELAYNRGQVLAYRTRRKPCPRGWTHACHRCIVGSDTCPGGTHPRTYELRFCPSCGEDSAYDLEISSAQCVLCGQRERLGRENES